MTNKVLLQSLLGLERNVVVDVALTATRNNLDWRWTARHGVEGKQVKGSQQPAVAVAVAVNLG
jgi:hypothetical protein